MASSAVEEYARQLRAAYGTGNGAAAAPVTGRDLALSIIALRRANTSAGAGRGGGVGGKNATDNPGWKRALDILSRTNYMMANAAKFATDEDPETGVIEGAWRGLSGQDKTHFADVYKQNHPERGNKVNAITGFAADVMLDPLTYVPATWIAKGLNVASRGRMFKKVDKPVEVAAKETNRGEAVSENALKGITVGHGPGRQYNPKIEEFLKSARAARKGIDKAKASAPTPAVSIPEGQTPRFVDFFTQSRRARENMAAGRNDPYRFALPAGNAVEGAKLNEQAVESAINTARKEVGRGGFPRGAEVVSSRAYLAQIAEAVAKINKPRRYAKDVKIDPLFQDVVTKKTRTVEKEFDELIPGTGVSIPAEKAIDDMTRGELREYVKKKMKDDPNLPVKVIDKGVSTEKKLGEIATRNTPKFQEFLDRYVTQQLLAMDKQPGKLTEIAGKYQTNIPGIETPNPPLKRKVKRKVNEEYEEVVPTRMSKEQRAEWVAKHRDTLDKDDITKLLRAQTGASFAKRAEEILAKRVDDAAPQFKTFAQAMDALEEGRLDPDDLKSMYELFPNAKTPKGLRREIERAVTRAKKIEDEFRSSLFSPPKVPKQKGKAAKTPEPNDVPPTAVAAPVDDAVLPAEEIIERAAAGDRSIFDSTKPELDEAQIETLRAALKFVADEDMLNPLDPKKYPSVTLGTGARRTHTTPGQGRGNNVGGYNSKNQYTAWKTVINDVSARLKAEGVKGSERASRFYDDAMPILQAMDLAVKKLGIIPVLGRGQQGIPMSYVDILNSMDRADVEKIFFANAYRSVAPEDLGLAAKAVIDAHYGKIDNLEEVLEDIINTSKFSSINYAANFKTSKTEKASAATLKGRQEIAKAEFINAIHRSKTAIVQQYEKNLAANALQHGDLAKRMSDQFVERVALVMRDPNFTVGDVIREVKNTSPQKIPGATDEAIVAAKAINESTRASALGEDGVKAAKRAEEMVNGGNPATVGAKAAKDDMDTTARVLDELDGVENFPLGEKIEAYLTTSLERMWQPFGSKFDAAYGHKNLHEMFRARRSISQAQGHAYRVLIGNIHRRNSKPALTAAFKLLQDGVKVEEVTDPVLRQAIEDLQPAVARIFDTSAKVDSKPFGIIARNGINPKHLNDLMTNFGVPGAYRFETNVKTPADAEQAWRLWEDVEDPLDLLDRLHAAVYASTVHSTLGSNFTAMFGTKVAQPGYVRLTDTHGQSLMYNFIDPKLFYPKEMAQQLRFLDAAMQGSRQFSTKEGPGRFVTQTLDPAIHSLKSGLTIYRPGHHVRNMVGDLWLSFFAGVNSPKPYYKAIKLMAERSGKYSDFNGLAALDTLPKNIAEGKKLFKARIGGKTEELSNDAVYRLAYRQGILPDFNTLEDISYGEMAASGGKIRQALSKVGGERYNLANPAGGRIRKVAGGASQTRDHYIRLAHFIDVLEKGNYKSLEDAANAAGAQVRKWHPDGSDLANFEHKYARRTFLFYSWMRKAIPLVIEAAVAKPGKTMIFPKAMYNYAEGAGIDLDSIADPFPPDQLFPEFLREEMLGPHFRNEDVPESLRGLLGVEENNLSHYRGFNPGHPTVDVFNDYISGNPARTIAGSANPLARIPIELGTGQNLRLGTPIMDKTDYIDAQIPGVNSIAGILNTSPSSGFTQEPRSVATGNENAGMDTSAFLNWLTGMGLRDLSRPSYINIAEQELRDRAAKNAQRALGG